MSAPTRIAVAGGAGFIGRHLCAALAASGALALPFGSEGPPEAHPEAALDALVWAGGRRGSDMALLHEQQVAAPLRALQRLGPRRLVYLSSAEVYGRAPVPFHEDGPVAPETAYGQAKRAGELALMHACAASSTALIVLRPAVIYGPDQAPTMLLPAALAALRAGQPFPCTAGEQTRDFLHVADLVALILRCLADDAPAGTYNAGSGREVRVREALTLLAAALGPDAAALLQLGALPTRPGEAQRYVVDIDRAAQRLGWHPRISLEDGLETLVHPLNSSARREPARP